MTQPSLPGDVQAKKVDNLATRGQNLEFPTIDAMTVKPRSEPADRVEDPDETAPPSPSHKLQNYLG